MGKRHMLLLAYRQRLYARNQRGRGDSNDRTADCQSHTHAFVLGRVEGKMRPPGQSAA
jgi:hypothetical protein